MFDTIQKWITSWQTGIDEQEADPQHALQLAAAVLLVEISRSDAHVATSEEKVIVSAIKKSFQLSEEEAQAMLTLANEKSDQSVSFYEFTKVINDQFDAEQKVELIRLLWEVAAADGEIDKYEDFYIRKVADLVYVSHVDFIRMKLQVLGTDDAN